jgi:hypothetical protein
MGVGHGREKPFRERANSDVAKAFPLCAFMAPVNGWSGRNCLASEKP